MQSNDKPSFFISFARTIRPLLIDQAYVDRKNEVIKAERRLLKELGFCVYVRHPHKVIAIPTRLLSIAICFVDDYYVSESLGKRT